MIRLYSHRQPGDAHVLASTSRVRTRKSKRCISDHWPDSSRIAAPRSLAKIGEVGTDQSVPDLGESYPSRWRLRSSSPGVGTAHGHGKRTCGLQVMRGMAQKAIRWWLIRRLHDEHFFFAVFVWMVSGALGWVGPSTQPNPRHSFRSSLTMLPRMGTTAAPGISQRLR